ncbi:UNVERIFIED_CONTAM: hypothetical protein FKN15_032327 [Acipenser sinensis]
MAAAEITLNRKPPLSSSNKKKILFLLLVGCFLYISWLQLGKWFDRPHLLPPNPGIHDTARPTETKVNEILQVLKRHVPAVNQTQLELTSSGAHSLVTLMNPKENYCVGEIVSVRVEMNDYRGKPKTYGGDFILARIHSPELKAGAAGVPEDFNNGTYRVNFTLFWPGSVKVSVLLMHSSEVLSTLWQAKEYCNDKFIFTGTFHKKTLQETTRCDINLSTNETVCEFKDERNQESFFCFKPKTLPCETLHYTTSRNSEASCLTDAENQLLKRLHDTARATEAEVNEILQVLKRHVPALNQTQLELTSSGTHSLVTLMNPKENYCVGEMVSVRVEMNDYRGKPKTYGGDFILARIHSPEPKAGAAGVPEDFNNGTYRVNFTLFWPGSVKVSVLLMHSSEVLSTLWQAKEYCNDKFIFTGTFHKKTLQETTRCDINLSTNEPVCEFKDKRNQESFSCFKPKTLPCETLHYTSSRNSKAACLTDAENQLLKRNQTVISYLIQGEAFRYSDCLPSGDPHWLTCNYRNPKENYCVGEIVSVRVEMNNYRGKPKTYGGDFILARIHSPELKAGAAGVPEDFNNGTYPVNFTLFWPGSVKVSVLLMHSSEEKSKLLCLKNRAPWFLADILNYVTYCLEERRLNWIRLNGQINYVQIIHMCNNNHFDTRKTCDVLVKKNIKDYLQYTSKTEPHAPKLAIDKKRNITMSWKMHGFPCISYSPCFMDGGIYIAQELDRLAGGENTVIAISVGQHLRPFPLKLYVTRLMNIKQAVTRLLQRSPLTRVFVKSENTRELNSEIIWASDWHGHLQNLALSEVFRGVKVGFIDAWEFNVAANSFDLHPNRNIVHNQIALFLSYLCGPSF